MAAGERPYDPPFLWRVTNAITLGTVGFLCRSFLYTLNRTEVHGLERFLEILDKREDEKGRERGLVTVSNHVSVLDDPLVWGVLPYRYFWNPNNMRWSLGSHDICFQNGFLSAFFTYGNTLPTHRAAHSAFGGLFQPTMTQCIRLLSDPVGKLNSSNPNHLLQKEYDSVDDSGSSPTSDPFSSLPMTYTTNGVDSFPAPSAYPCRRHSWVHIFPEGMTHQHPDKVMRYFKWGVARLILESEPCPDVLPMWIDGPQEVMDNERPFPKPVPRAGKDIKVTFGDLVDREAVFGKFRERWRELKERAKRNKLGAVDDGVQAEELGVLVDHELKFGKEAEQLRIEVTLAVRDQVLKVRRACGLEDEDPKRGLADSYREEDGAFGRDGLKKDGSTTKGV